MKRSKVREVVFKILFRAEFNDVSEMPQQMIYFFEQNESELTDEETEYIKEREIKILDKLSEIDGLINAKATGWTTERMGKVDLAIIRLAVYEILYDDEIPVGVSINEAVELAKKYGMEESYGFVNGVLAKFA